VTGLLDHKEVFECVAFLLPTVILLLLLRVFWTLDWVFGPTMKKRARDLSGRSSLVDFRHAG
jgi:hypothetical protein